MGDRGGARRGTATIARAIGRIEHLISGIIGPIGSKVPTCVSRPAALSRPCHAPLLSVTRSPTWTLHRREPARRRRRGLTLLLRPWRRRGASPGKLQQNTKKVRVRSALWSQVVWEIWPGSRTRPRWPLPPLPNQSPAAASPGNHRVILPAMSLRAALVLHGPNLNLLGSREPRSEEHTSELQSQSNLVCRLLL